MKAKKLTYIIISAVIFLSVMYFTEQLLQPGYWLKALIKASLTAAVILGFSAIFREKFPDVIWFRKMKPARRLLLLMLGVFCVVLLAFQLLQGQLDLPEIRANLVRKEQLTKQNCLFVFGYIALVNSFLEEALFRGLYAHKLTEALGKPWGMLLSAGCFAVYHIGIVDSWVSIGMLLFTVAALFAAGIVLQLVCDHYDSLKASWIVHGCANLAINTVGVILMFRF